MNRCNQRNLDTDFPVPVIPVDNCTQWEQTH